MKRILVVLMLLGGLVMGQSSPVFQNCQGCHQPAGTGMSGVFPPLAGHVPDVLAAKGGRTWIINLVLNGMSGQISVKGTNYNGAMPSFKQLSDQQVADVLNHISSQWGNKLPAGQKAFTAAEVKAQRATTMTAADVNKARAALGLK